MMSYRRLFFFLFLIAIILGSYFRGYFLEKLLTNQPDRLENKQEKINQPNKVLPEVKPLEIAKASPVPSGIGASTRPLATKDEGIEKEIIEEKNIQWQAPLDKAEQRITKKKFGMYISPETSPVQPEKFEGYHTGVDWEILSGELEKEIAVKAVCDGFLKLKTNASGYGGVAIQLCENQSEPITVVYGHLKLASISPKVGEEIKKGDVIGLLGADKSQETDGTRKHLHLAFHQGENIELKGYISNEENLVNWIDPCLYLCQ